MKLVRVGNAKLCRKKKKKERCGPIVEEERERERYDGWRRERQDFNR